MTETMVADEKEFMPKVIMLPEAQAEIDAAIAEDPELGAAITAFKESAMNAMQGVHDGRYKSFEEAMEALTGQRPELVLPRYETRFGYFLTIGPNPKGDGVMAVITDGSVKQGHVPVHVLDVDIFKTAEDAQMWFKRQCMLEPWADKE